MAAIPAGLEMVFDLEKANARTPLDAFIISLHWGIIRAGLRVKRSTDSNELTERMPPNWYDRSSFTNGIEANLSYYDASNINSRYEMKVIGLTTSTYAVTIVRIDPDQETVQASSKRPSPVSAATTFDISKFINFSVFDSSDAENSRTVSQVYPDGSALELKIWQELMEPMGLRVVGLPGTLGPYDDKTKPEPKTNNERQGQGLRTQPSRPQYPRPGIPAGGSLPLIRPVHGIPAGLGRSDLDPLGGLGTGMIGDLRGLRGPRMGGPNQPNFPGNFPGGVPPPGARFDPYGPPNPNNPGPGGGTGANFVVPNPDVEQPPPGFDDMFM